MALSQTSVLKLYNTVIADVIEGVRESFMDEGVDEQVLQELKQIWEGKLMASKAVELNPDPPEPQVPQINTHKAVSVNRVPQTQAQQQQPQQQQPQTQPQSQSQQPSQPQQHVHSTTGTLQQQQPQQQQQQPSSTPVHQVVTASAAVLERHVPIQITLPPQPGVPDSPQRILSIQVPASTVQGNQLHTILTGPVISAAMGLPADLASTLLQQHVNSTLQGQATLTPLQVNQPLHVITQRPSNNNQKSNINQLDGGVGDSTDDDDEEEEEDNDDDDEDLDEKEEEENDEAAVREEEPLNSEDDVTDDDPTDLFDTDNVVVCQYDKITRSRNKWKFYLKDGIMNLSGKDYVFQKANGDAEW
ncbi:hypothetical protein P5V15_009492 [Pogonomyrmex californicus]